MGDFFEGLGPDGSQTAPQPFAARVAAASGLRRLVEAYGALASEWERERLVQAVEVIVRPNDSGAVSP